MIDEHLKWQVLVVLCVASNRRDLAKKSGKGRLLAKNNSQSQCVDEESNKRLNLLAVAIGNRRTNDDVVLAAVAMQQNDKDRQQNLVQCDTTTNSNLVELLIKILRNLLRQL